MNKEDSERLERLEKMMKVLLERSAPKPIISSNYDKFVKWVMDSEDKQAFYTHNITTKFRVGKHTANDWMRVLEDSAEGKKAKLKYIEGRSYYPARLIRKMNDSK